MRKWERGVREGACVSGRFLYGRGSAGEQGSGQGGPSVLETSNLSLGDMPVGCPIGS